MYYCCSFLLPYFYLIILLVIVFFWHWNLHAEDKVNKVVVVYCLHIQSELACSRHSDREDSAKTSEQKKKTTTRTGWERGNFPSSSFPPYFFLALFLRAALHYPNAWNRIKVNKSSNYSAYQFRSRCLQLYL